MKTPKLTAKMGAQVQFCGHNGYFMADIFVIGDVAAVRASGPVSPDKLFRNQEYGPPTHHLVDFPDPGMWEPKRGVFVVPASQVRVIAIQEAA